jgi:pyruvate kinase
MPTRPPVAAVTPDLDRPTRAKIVATLGPASESPETVLRMIEAGVSVFRLNFSHGDFEAHGRRLAIVREMARLASRPVAVLGDLCGPKIRVGRVPQAIEVLAGQDVLLSRRTDEAMLVRERIAGSEVLTAVLPVTYPALVDEVEPGHRVLINDGAVRMLAVERTADAVRCRVTIGGIVTTGKGINLPDTDMQVPAITARDWECVEWSVRNSLDFLALSFVRRAAEVLELKARLAGMCPVDPTPGRSGQTAMGSTIPVVAKIEKPQAVEAIDEIVDAADAVMVARGDLGVEMELSQVPIVQKKILERCEQWGKPCIVATQMLESMIENASPTRAEVSDVANAIFDGADAVMLSGETAVGRHVVLAVETMRRTIAAAEARISEMPAESSPPLKLVESRYPTAALAHGAWHIAMDVSATMIVCWSEGGGTARYLSQNHFRVPIVAYTSSELTARRMALLKSVIPIHRAPPASGTLGEFTDIVERDLLEQGWARHGDAVVLMAGKPLGAARATNSIALLYVGDPRGGYRSHRS